MMMRFGQKVDRWLYRIEKVLATYLFVGITIFVVAQIVTRYILKSPIAGTDELSRFSLVALTMIGAAMVSGTRQGHIAADFLANRLSARSRIMHELIICATLFLTSAFLVYCTVAVMPSAAYRKSASLGVAMSIVYVPMAIGFVGIMIHSALKLATCGRLPQEQEEPNEEEVIEPI